MPEQAPQPQPAPYPTWLSYVLIGLMLALGYLWYTGSAHRAVSPTIPSTQFQGLVGEDVVTEVLIRGEQIDGALARELASDRDRLAGKKIVVYQFAVRELSIGNWKLIDLGPP